VFGVHLAVQELESPRRELPDQADQRDLRRIAPPVEHRLAEEGGAERDPVDPAQQLAVAPRLRGVGEALGMEGHVGVDHGRGDPGALLIATRALCAGPDHGLEGGVEAHLGAALPQGAPQPSRHHQLAGPQHPARVRGEPEDRLLLVPGEDSGRVGLEEALGPQVPPDGQQTARLGLARVGEQRLGAQAVDRHGVARFRRRQRICKARLREPPSDLYCLD
jgi:hypothetical protein